MSDASNPTPETAPGARADALGDRDDIVAAFQVEDRAVRGRSVRLGAVMDDILSAHDYPAPVARLLGEAVMIAALIGDSIKFDGKLIVQANGDGPVQFIVAEYVSGEGVRGFAKIDRDAVEAALDGMGEDDSLVQTLLGDGAFAMTIDQGPDMDQYQGVAPLSGGSLTESAEHYFLQSEQVPTRIRLAVGEIWKDDGVRRWRGGGMLIQAMAADEARGDTDEDWSHGLALFETIEDAELLDPDLSMGRLLFRLFNEDGVRVFDRRDLVKRCACDRQKLVRVIASFPEAEAREMAVDGKVVMTCEYCAKDFPFTLDEIASARGGR